MAYPPKPTSKQYGTWFPDIAERGVPSPPGDLEVSDSSLALQPESSSKSAETVSAPKRIEFGALRLYVDGAGRSSRSHDDGPSFDYKAKDIEFGGEEDEDADAFCFAPGVDEAALKIAFHVHGLPSIKSAKLELFCRDHTTPIWEQHWGDAWGKKKAEITAFPAKSVGMTDFGTLPWSDVKPDTSLQLPGPDGTKAAAFPAGLLTVARSPYQLRLTVSGKAASTDSDDLDQFVYPSTAWTYIHVLIHSFTYRFGKPEWLPAQRDDIDAEFREKVVGKRTAGEGGAVDYGLEGELLERMRQLVIRNKTTKAEVMDGSTLHAVELRSPIVRLRGQTKDTEVLQKAWGNGARIPLVCSARIRTVDQQPTTEKAADVLAGASVVWDWVESDAKRWEAATRTGAGGESVGGDLSRTFLAKVHTDHGLGLFPADSTNCPITLGGKLGDDAAPVFLPQDPAGDGATGLPWKVQPCAIRAWAVRTAFDAKGEAGVVFHPSRFAGDHYKVRTILAEGVAVDVTGDIPDDTAIGSPGVFEVFRALPVLHVVLGATPDVDIQGLVDTACERARRQAHLKLQLQTVVLTGTERNEVAAAAIKRAGAKPGVWGIHRHYGFEVSRLVKPRHSGVALLDTLSWADFKAAVQSAFQTGTLRLIKHPTPTSAPLAEGWITDAGSSGAFVDIGDRDANGPVCWLFTDPGQAIPADGSTVKGPGTNTVHTITYASQAKSCWGLRLASATGVEEKDVEVNFPGNNIKETLTYKKSGIARRLGTDLDDDMKSRLKSAFERSVAAFNEQGMFTIRIAGRSDTKGATTRLENIRSHLHDLAKAGTVVDRAMAFDRYRDASATGTRDEWTKLLTDTEGLFGSIAEGIAAELIERKKLEHGVVIVQSSLISNVGVAQQLERAAIQDPIARQALSVFEDYPTGGWVNGALPGLAERGLVYLVTPSARGVSFMSRLVGKVKAPWAVFLHELGHSMGLPHAVKEKGRPGTTAPSPAPKFHVKDEHCLMSYDAQSDQLCGLCMLRLRGWQYQRLTNEGTVKVVASIDLGPTDALFDDDAGTDEGKQARLQAMGLFNRPLGLATRPKFLTEYAAGWAYSWALAKRLLPGLDGAPGKTLDEELKKFLVDGGKLPADGAQAKLRVWAGFSPWYSNADLAIRYQEHNFSSKHDRAEKRFKMNAVRADIEAAYQYDNPAIGAYPLRVTVKGDQGEPIPGMEVRLELVTPDAPAPWVPNFAGTKVAGATTFVSATGPAPGAHATVTTWFQTHVESHDPSAGTDPQAENVHADMGGKRKLVATAGDVRTPRPADGLRNIFSLPSANLLPPSLDSASQPVENAVKLVTNSEGQADLLFTPSVIGGDRYKLKVSVLDGAGNVLTTHTTGTLVVWRSYRLGGLYRMPGVTTAKALSKAVAEIVSTSGKDPAELLKPQVTYDLKKLLGEELAKGYCELSFDDAALTSKDLDGAFFDRVRQRMANILTDWPDAGLATLEFSESYRVPMKPVGKSKTTFKARIPTSAMRGQTIVTATEGGDYDAFCHDFDDTLDPATTDVWPLKSLAKDEKVRGLGTKKKAGNAVAIDGTSKVDYAVGEVTLVLSADHAGPGPWVGWIPGVPWDLDAVFEPFAPSPFLMPFTVPKDYNKRRSPRFPDAEPMTGSQGRWEKHVAGKNDMSLADTLALRAISGEVGEGQGQCFAPGIQIIQANFVHPYAWKNGDALGGKGVGNTALLFTGCAGSQKHLEYLLVHECGHAWYGIHAPDEVANAPELHDADRAAVCVMGDQKWDKVHGGYCGKCQANLRGLLVLEGPLHLAGLPGTTVPKFTGNVKAVRQTGLPPDPPDPP